MSAQAIELRDKVGLYFASKKQRLIECWEKQEFPHEMLAELAAMGLGGIRTSKQYGGLGLSYFDMCAILLEVGRHDQSMYTFIGGHNGLGQAMIIELAGEE